MSGWVRIVLGSLALAGVLAEPALADYKVSIRRGAHGIPHIRASDFPSLGYGYGYAFAQDNVCVMADTYLTVRAERSRYFGPGGSYLNRGNGSAANNLNSDFFFQRIIDEKVVEKLISEPPPAGPLPEIKQAVKGYVDGYNEYLREVGVDNIRDPACRGKEWVKPIEEIDAYRRFYQLALLASSGVAVDGIGGAQPPFGGGGDEEAARREQLRALDKLDPNAFDDLLGLGSNAYGLGKAATRSGHGMVLGNPHFPWEGSERFYQAHLTVPGKVNTQGGALFGVPLSLIGNTDGLAWSHTVSTARRFTLFELKLVPGDPTSYFVDGQPRKMDAITVTVQVRGEDGKLTPRSRTLYSTHHGRLITSILGLPVFPWTASSAYAMGDANAGNFRYLNHFYLVNQAQTVDELDGILKKYLGIPWVNTIAADSRGRAYYADVGSVPNVSTQKIADCSVPLGNGTDAALRVQVLDGARAGCDWDTDPDAIKPGIFGPSKLPFLFRDDYVHNGNDSYWLSNPMQPLEGFSRVIGDERTTRTPRTRLGLRIVQQRLDGSDGHEGKGFTLRQLQDAVFNNRQYLGELWRDELVAFCKANPMLPGSRGPVDVSEGCAALEKWDLKDDLGSRGALLFRRFAGRAATNPVSSAAPQPVSPFDVPFDPADPVNTPRGLNTDSPQVQAALADAVTDLRGASIPLDAPLGEFQYEMRGDERIPIHGGPGTVGVFNAINVSWDAAKGYPDVAHGSSFVQAVELLPGCPDVRTILTYSLSTDRTSPYYADQTRMYSRKEWVDLPFCDSELAKVRDLKVTEFGGGVPLPGAAGELLRRVRVRALRGRRAVVTFRVVRRATVRAVARRARAARRARLRPGVTHRLVVRGLRGSRARIRITAQAGSRRHTVARTVRVRR